MCCHNQGILWRMLFALKLFSRGLAAAVSLQIFITLIAMWQFGSLLVTAVTYFHYSPVRNVCKAQKLLVGHMPVTE